MKNILKSYRENTGLSQSETAEKLGISRTYLSEIERGVAVNLSHNLAVKILNLWSEPEHGTIEVVLPRRVHIDALIAPEIVWLNSVGIVTEASCQGPPPTAMIKPSSVDMARIYGYNPRYREERGLFEITLKTEAKRDDGKM